jgi:hypothetical protein
MNSFKEPDQPVADPEQGSEKAATSKQGNFARSINKILNGEFLTRDSIINHLPFIGFLTGLFLLHISLMYFFENTQREIVRTQRELNELNSDYKTTESELEMRQQQSQVALDMQQLGLEELRVPPQKIYVNEDFFSAQD